MYIQSPQTSGSIGMGFGLRQDPPVDHERSTMIVILTTGTIVLPLLLLLITITITITSTSTSTINFLLCSSGENRRKGILIRAAETCGPVHLVPASAPPIPLFLNPKPQTLNPKAPNPKPQTLNPRPKTLNLQI